jgi:hypothetical protein
MITEEAHDCFDQPNITLPTSEPLYHFRCSVRRVLWDKQSLIQSAPQFHTQTQIVALSNRLCLSDIISQQFSDPRIFPLDTWDQQIVLLDEKIVS